MIKIKIRKVFLSLLTAGAVLASCSTKKSSPEQNWVDFVDPYIGSDYHGHVFVGASVPFGAVQLGPSNVVKGWDWCSGYHYSDSILVGFAHTHLSGTGIGDLGDVLFMPVSDAYQPSADSTLLGWQSKYSHARESVKPGFYSVHIERYNVDAELTTSERVGFHKYQFNAEGNSFVLVDLGYGIGWDKLTEGIIEQSGESSITGHRFSKGWADDQRLFFATEFSKKIKGIEFIPTRDVKGEVIPGQTTALIQFEGNGELLAKTAISPVSVDGAKNNLQKEIAHWNFDETYQAARNQWNNELGRIRISTNNETDKKTFYTALYHTMIAPSLFNDANGDYRGADKEVHTNPGHNTYTTFSLWDTYRAAHPLFTLVQPERVNDFVNTMLNICEQQGKLPVWHLMGNETNCMVGYHAVPVIVDAYFKGFNGFDAERAFQTLKTTAMLDERGIKFIKELGYIPADSTNESVAMALEYAIDDWCIAAMASKMGKTEDAEYFGKRAKYYQNYFDTQTKFMRGKLADGSWRTPFDPGSSQHRNDDYCEGNSWQYTWLVPQDVEGLISLQGGDEAFTSKLDSLFVVEFIRNEGSSNDISGLIGQYAHGNEPSHHITYMYAYAGQQWKTAKLVSQINHEMYHEKPDGLCGNEDCGQMSAWYVLSSMGFYPANPANGAYIFGSPSFDKAEIELSADKSFAIVAENLSKENIYIQSAELNGQAYSKSYITHKQILEGGTLELVMGPEPNKSFGAASEDRPKSIIY